MVTVESTIQARFVNKIKKVVAAGKANGQKGVFIPAKYTKSGITVCIPTA